MTENLLLVYKSLPYLLKGSIITLVSVNFSGVVRGRLEKKRIVTIVTFFLGEYYEQ